MKVFVFGAGASRGSQEADASERAPLVNELFATDYLGHARLAGLEGGDMAIFRQAVGEIGNGSLEEWLTRKWESIETLQEDISKQAERGEFGRLAFYFASLLLAVSKTYTETNGYSIFALKLRKLDKPWALINFNYDTLLDLALHHRFTWDFGSIKDYLALNYLKPHGSVNWYIPPRRGLDPELFPHKEVREEGERDIRARLALAARLMFNGPPMRGDDIIVIRPNHLDLQDTNFGRLLKAFGWSYFYPLVLMPLTTKMYSVVEGFEQRIVGKGTEFMGRATEIYLIGYRANDQIIREMMGGVNKESHVHVIGRSDAEEISSRVCSWSRYLKPGIVYEAGFLEFVRTEM